MDLRPMTAPASPGRFRSGTLRFGSGGLRRQGTAHFGKDPKARGKLLVVAVDSSRLARRSMYYAAWLMNTNIGSRDKIKLVTVAKTPADLMDAERLVRDGSDLLVQLGVLRNDVQLSLRGF